MNAFHILKVLRNHNYVFRILEHEKCEGCDAPVEVKNNRFVAWRGTLPLCHVLEGDIVRCTKCQCQGHVAIDEIGAYVLWPDDVCAACYRDMDNTLMVLTRRLKEMLEGNFSGHQKPA